MPRIFVALDVDEAVRREAAACQHALAEKVRPVHWVPVHNVHLTLRFLGEVPQSRLGLVEESVRRVARVTPPLHLVLGGLTAFPSPKRPRVLVLDVARGRELLGGLFHRLDSELLARGFAASDRPLRPHLTLGRGAGPLGALPHLAAPKPLEWRVDEILIMESELTSPDPTYHRLVNVPFQG